jgi:tetratricopeptide (TPR) repeat protein
MLFAYFDNSKRVFLNVQHFFYLKKQYYSLVFVSMSSKQQLSERDLSILNLIFEKSPPATVDLSVPSTTAAHVENLFVKDCDEELTGEIVRSKQLENDGIRLTEQSKFDEALAKFNEAIEIAPNRATLYNNRAQLYQFVGNHESMHAAIISFTKY